MLGDCEETEVLSSSTTNEWSQNLMASSTTTTRVNMEKPGQYQSQQQQQQQPPQQPLRCPRCDSSNTKFCYYNNYSLSQPRHFCKACKRYWTRGGTLRNVPVGGGCRKNKRVKRPNGGASSTIDVVDSSSDLQNPSPNRSNQSPSQIVVSSGISHVNPLFYGLPSNPSEMNFSFPRFSSTSGYDLLPNQLNGFGLGFSSNGFNPGKQIQDGLAANSLLSSYSSMFGSTASYSNASTITATSPTIASLLASPGLSQQKLIKDNHYFQGLTPFDQFQMASSTSDHHIKEIKIEERQNRMDDWDPGCQNQMEDIGLSDPTVDWNSTSVGTWHDPANIGSHWSYSWFNKLNQVKMGGELRIGAIMSAARKKSALQVLNVIRLIINQNCAERNLGSSSSHHYNIIKVKELPSREGIYSVQLS